MKRLALLLGVLISSLFQLLGAQDTLSVKPGDRIRIAAPECGLRLQTGTLISLDRDRFIGRLGGELVRCPTEDLTRLEVSASGRSIAKGAVIGLGVGTGAALLILSSNSEEDRNPAMIVGGILVVSGLLIGTTVGIICGRGSWRRVPLPPVQPYLDGGIGGRIDLGFSIPMRR